MRLNLLDICRVLGTVCVGMRPEDALTCPTGAAVDSRKVKPGDLFFCLPGEKTDGHDFADSAVKNGALAVIASRDIFGKKKTPVPVIRVHDVARALGIIGSAHRATARATVVGVTGTAGKTSVKETLASVLATVGTTAKNAVNQNNQIGLPLSMLNASEKAAYWVMEAGISHPHDMDELGMMLRPDIALILNAGAGHVQGLGDKGTAYYKARLLAHLAPGGRGIVCADYPDLVREAGEYAVDIAHFSAHNAEVAYYAAYRELAGFSHALFDLSLDGEAVGVRAPFPGAFGAENVAAIGAVAHTLGLTAPEIAAGFAAATLPDQRFTVRETGDFLLIDDSYNANPLSMARMLEAAAIMAKARQSALVLVLGEMGELGDESEMYHYQLGQMAADVAPNALIWKGGQGEAVSRGLRDAGFTGSFMHVGDAASFTAAFFSCDVHSGVVLFKGSRSNKLEESVTAFMTLEGASDKETTDAL